MPHSRTAAMSVSCTAFDNRRINKCSGYIHTSGIAPLASVVPDTTHATETVKRRGLHLLLVLVGHAASFHVRLAGMLGVPEEGLPALARWRKADFALRVPR